MKKIFLLGLFSFMFIWTPFESMAANCPANITPSLGLLDPACWKQTWVNSSATVNCTWTQTGSEKICVPCTKFFGCDWSSSYTTTGDCGSDNHYADNIFLKDECGNTATWCTNVGAPATYTKTVDTSGWDYTCYYTTPATWSAPDATGKRLATSVNQLSTPGSGCSNASNVIYVNAEPNLEINGSGSAITVNKADPIDIKWSSNYATSCNVPASNTGVNWSGLKAVNGDQLNTDISMAPKPTSEGASPITLNYAIACTNPGLVNVLDTVPVTITCTPYSDSAWSECSNQCGTTGDQIKLTRYANCYEKVEHQACNRIPCPVSSEWREVRP